MDEEEIDFAVAAWREEGRWSVASLPPRALDSLGSFLAALRQLTGEGGALGFIAVEEEFFIGVRVMPDGATRVVLSDLNAAYDWSIAEEAALLLEVELPEDEEELDEIEPVGDLGFAADLGLSTSELEILLDDPDLYPDEQVASIAARVGFAEQLAATLEALPEA